MARFFILFLLLFFTLCTVAQKTSKAKLTEASVVKDTAGHEVPAVIWKQLVMSSGYAIYPVDAFQETSPFIIRHLTPAERTARMEKMPRPRETRAFRTGKSFATFADKDLNGNSYNMKELKGKVVVINFWFINCPPCRMEIPELNNLVKSYDGNKDVVFLAIALDEKFQLHQFLKAMPFHYNIISNGTYLAKKYNINSFPTHVVVDKEGLVRFHTTGLAKNTVYWVQKSIEEALKQPVSGSVATNQ